jgi:tRNA threonylcarbamoyladenosine biosynthesis protein TsaE
MAVTLSVPTDTDMRSLGERLAHLVRGGDVLLLSGPLGAGKTTLAQGFGAGLGIDGPIVSPTFTIARELDGRFADGTPAHLIHVDAYRLGGSSYAPGQDTVGRLLDELESLGLDEELEDPGENTVILMEWGEQMATALAPERLEIHIERPIETVGAGVVAAQAAQEDEEAQADQAIQGDQEAQTAQEAQGDGKTRGDGMGAELTSGGTRTVTVVPVGARWSSFSL